MEAMGAVADATMPQDLIDWDSLFVNLPFAEAANVSFLPGHLRMQSS